MLPCESKTTYLNFSRSDIVLDAFYYIFRRAYDSESIVRWQLTTGIFVPGTESNIKKNSCGKIV